MSNTCPISFEKVDSNVSRFSSLFTSALVITYLVTFNSLILYFLLFEFFMKLFCKKEATVTQKLSKFMKSILRLEDKFSDSGAKRLAGYFAIFFLLLLVAGNNLNLYAFSIVVGTIFLFCSLLDAFFNYCIGCKIYFLIKKVNPNFMS